MSGDEREGNGIHRIIFPDETFTCPPRTEETVLELTDHEDSGSQVPVLPVKCSCRQGGWGSL